MASAGLNLASSALKLGVALLAQHSLRLKDAKTENAAIPPVVAAFDADVSAIVAAYNSGQATPATCAQACAAVDANIRSSLQNGTVSAGGKPIPGTAWNSTSGFAGKCDKTCTAGCCVYYGDLGPVLSLMTLVMGGAPLYQQWGAKDPRLQLTSTGAVITVPEVFASKYGGQDRPSYQITLTRPPAVASVEGNLKQSIAEIFGTPQTGAGGVVASLAAGGAPVAASPASNSKVLLIFGVGLVALIAVLAGSR